jgi:signal transduction histidine kinase/ligand-binding sensor domain-containing protein
VKLAPPPKFLSLWFALSWALLAPAAAQTLSPQRLLGRYQQFSWQDQHGLPQNGISTVVQTPDGYLWLATAEGVVRFDGVRFTVFDSVNTPELKSNNIGVLLVDRVGALWAGYSGGLTRYQDGRFTYYGTAQGLADLRVVALFADRAGQLWIGTQGGGLRVYRDGHFTTYTTQDGLPDNRIRTFAEAADGGLWIGTLGGLARFQDGQFTNYSTRDGLVSGVVSALWWDRTGTLWVGAENGGLTRWQAGRFSTADVPAAVQRQRIQVIAEDRAGNLWFGTNAGLLRYKDGRFEACNERDGLVNDDVQAIYPAPNGDLWLGTNGGGLALLKTGRFSVYTAQDGLPDEVIGSLCGDGAGHLWVNTRSGLSRFKGGQFTSMTVREGLPAGGGRALATDRAGNLLASAPGQVLRYQAGRFSPYVSKAGLAASHILADQAGRLWVGTSFDGVLCFHEGAITAYTTREGLAENYITALFEDRAGNLWIGTGSGVSRLSNGRVTTWAHKDGYPGRHMLAFYEDRAGQIWMGTDGNGLLRFKDGQFRAITVKDGLYDNLAFQILEDDNGNLWMSGNKGIYRASLRALNEFADGRSKTVTSFAYGAVDGMLSRECNGASPAGWKTADGHLWFPTIKGLVAVNPQKLDTVPPRVVIEQVMLDGAALVAGQPLRINPGQERLEIQYTALGWNRPQQLRFKYQLAGLDDTWVETGTRRTAYFQHLPPGMYTFRVRADNGEGVWNETGASLSFVVLTPFYRSWWFVALAALGVAGLALSGYKLRVRQLERANAAQQEFSRRLINAHEGERQRIAAELHDGLSQSLAIIRQRATICLQAKDDPRRQQEQMEEIAEAATAVIDEVREIIYDLRPVQLDRLGLTNSLREMLDKVGQAHGLTIEQELDELNGGLSKEAENSLYRIVQEAVNNIVRHARATRASVRLQREPGALRLVVADDGCGFIPDASRDWAMAGGLGLTGIHERARLLQGDLLVESAPQQGTTITLWLPLP